MCGLFGVIGHDPDPGLVVTVAQLAATRGPHGYGWAWLEEHQLKVQRSTRPLAKDAHRLAAWPDVRHRRYSLAPMALVGHARLATSGSRGDADAYQPITADDLAIAHNGTVRNYDRLVHERGLSPATGVDSEVIALLAAEASGSPGERIAAALNAVDASTPLALLALFADGRVYAGRRRGAIGDGHPLWSLTRNGTTYLCSRRPGPGWDLLPDDRLLEFGPSRADPLLAPSACRV